jgi:rare lipoprotein A
MGSLRFIVRSSAAAAVAFLLCVQPVEATQCGQAAWYEGGKTASGEMSGPTDLTAAHRSLPFGTNVLVENLANGLQVTVRVNDRGPFSAERMIDLSRSAAEHIGMVSGGTARVRITTSEETVSAPDGGC